MNIESEIIQKVMAGAKTFTKQTPVMDGVVLQCGDSLTPTPVSWLWPGWLARAKVHILAGAPGTGKTTIAIAFAATITSGGRWPDGTPCEAGNVIVWSGEDDPADTLLPRLMAAGGNRSRIHFVDSTRIAGESLSFDPARDMRSLQTAAEKIGNVRLILVDPIVSAVTGDSHKNTETRRALQPLVDLASNMNAVLLGITHFSKGGQGGDPSQRVLGSVAFTAVARVVLVAAKVQGEDGKDKRILARSKSNIGPDSGGFEYHLEQGEPLPGIEASFVSWGEAVQGSARELLTDPNEQETDDGDAATLLKAELVADSWTNSELASKPLKAAGFTKKQIWSASKKISVIRKKGGMNDGWYWRLPGLSEVAFHIVDPEESPEDSEGSNFRKGESSESSDEMESSVEGEI